MSKEKEFKLSRNSKKHLKGVNPHIVELIERVIKKSPHDFGIPSTGGFRSAQVQNNLYHQKPKVTNIDGFKNKSYHQTGMAFDIFVYDEHGACWDCKKKYKEISEVFKAEFKLMQEACIFEETQTIGWGGDWRFKDEPHFEVR